MKPFKNGDKYRSSASDGKYLGTFKTKREAQKAIDDYYEENGLRQNEGNKGLKISARVTKKEMAFVKKKAGDMSVADFIRRSIGL